MSIKCFAKLFLSIYSVIYSHSSVVKVYIGLVNRRFWDRILLLILIIWKDNFLSKIAPPHWLIYILFIMLSIIIKKFSVDLKKILQGVVSHLNPTSKKNECKVSSERDTRSALYSPHGRRTTLTITKRAD